MADEDTKKSTPLSDFHLRNPLKFLTWFTQGGKLPMRQRWDKTYLNQSRLSVTVGDPIDLVLGTAVEIPSQSTEVMEEASHDVLLRLGIDMQLFMPEFRPDMKLIRDGVTNIDKQCWDSMRFWNYVLTLLNANSSDRNIPSLGGLQKGGVVKYLVGEHILHIMRSSVLIQRSQSKSGTLYDGDWVRMASDVWTQRFLVLISVEVGKATNEYQYPPARLINKVISWGDHVLSTLRIKGYKVLKTYEAIMVGVVQSKGSADIIDPCAFLKNTLNDLTLDDIESYKMASLLVDIVKEVDNHHHLIQLYGLYRIWGHPMVDGTAGMEKVAKIGKKNIIRSHELAQDAGRMFKRVYSMEHRRRHGVFPVVHAGITKLHTMIADNDMDATDMRIVPLQCWDRIRFKQMYQLPETFNLSMIVADKAISPTKSELIQSIKQKGTVQDAEKRRGVKRWLDDNTLRPKEFLTDINNGIFPDDHLIIGLTPKERELNSVPRMFALMSHKLRVYVVVTEQMISEHILSYFPQITMTDSLLDLTKKVYSTVKNQSALNKNKGGKGTWASRTVCMSLDFEKWNGHMRKSMTSSVFTSLGELFGLSELFNMTYDLFENSYIYLADGSYIPSHHQDVLIIEEPNSFTNHKGGMEGLRQKGWTVFTVCALIVVLSRYNCSFKIMGMGDNQVLQITIYTSSVDELGNISDKGLHEIKSTLSLIFKDLVKSFTDMGLPLKPLETWVSEDLYLYGKWPLWKGVPLAMDLKKLMRMFPMSNADVMTLENALGTVSGNAIAATQSSSCIWTSYVINLLMSSICVQDFMTYHPLLGFGYKSLPSSPTAWVLAMSTQHRRVFKIPSSNLSTRQLRIAIMTIPKTLGGYNGTNLFEMMMRGFPDNLSRDVSYLYAIKDHSPNWLKRIIDNWLCPMFMMERNYNTLMQDVTGVNLVAPRSPMSGIKQTVSQYMTEGLQIKNTEFNDLMKSKDKMLTEYLSACLCEGSTLHIRLIHDIYESTIFGYVDSVLSKVTKASTIQRLAMGSSIKDVFQVITRDEINYYNFFSWRSQVAGEINDSLCPTSWCKRVRKRGWGKDLRGVTTPYPYSFLKVTDCSSVRGCGCSDGYLSVHLPDGQLTNDSWNFNIGGNPPYLGSKTKEKVIVGSGNKIYSSEPLVRRPINLLKTINWFVPPDSMASKVICATVSAVTDMNPEPFKGVMEGTAGSEVHRYRDSSTSHGCLTSSNFLFSTRYHLSTDNLTRYAKGSDNTDIHYQAVFCMMTEMTNMYISNRLRQGETIVRFFHYNQSCYSCINPIPEDFIDFPSNRALSAIPSRKRNEYLFVSHEKIRVLERLSPLTTLSVDVMTAEKYDAMTPSGKRFLLQDYLIDRIITDITSKSVDDEIHVNSGLTDVKAYERTMYLKLDPKYIMRGVVRRLNLLSEISFIKEKGRFPIGMESDLRRRSLNILHSCNTQKLLGIGMFYCWEETAKKMMFMPGFTVPETNPVSISSSCAAVRRNLICMLSEDTSIEHWRVPIIIEEEKSNSNLILLLLYQEISKRACLQCRLTVAKLDKTNISELKRVDCDKGHKIFDRLTNQTWKTSRITVERLRKDCDSDMTSTIAEKISYILPTQPTKVTITRSSAICIMPSATETQQNPIGSPEFSRDHYELNVFHLMMTVTKPTSSIYKYIDILSGLYNLSGDGKVFVVGDGLGTTSDLISSLFEKGVVSSTIIQPDDAIPQTYVHNVTPISFSGSVDNNTKINMPNNILAPDWTSSWTHHVGSCSMLVSDVEVIDATRSNDRRDILRKLLNLKSWKLAVVKDYIYSVADLSNNMAVVGARCKSWQLVTSRFRSAHYPEVWWICCNVEPNNRDHLKIDARNLAGVWGHVIEQLTDNYMGSDVKDIITKLHFAIDRKHEARMMSYLKEWLYFPGVGSMIPDAGDYTSIFYYLNRTKKPSYVKLQRTSKHLKLYNSDYVELKEKLFALAGSMIADVNKRVRFLNDSASWALDWNESKSGSWRCFLYKLEDPSDYVCKINDYIPILSLVMMRRNLLFKSIPDQVVFRHCGRSRNSLCFPITKTADQKL